MKPFSLAKFRKPPACHAAYSPAEGSADPRQDSVSGNLLIGPEHSAAATQAVKDLAGHSAALTFAGAPSLAAVAAFVAAVVVTGLAAVVVTGLAAAVVTGPVAVVVMGSAVVALGPLVLVMGPAGERSAAT